jgi:hypothetical protein
VVTPPVERFTYREGCRLQCPLWSRGIAQG